MRYGRLIDAVPVLRNLALSLVERQTPGTNFGMEIILHFIFGMRASVWDGRLERFRPEIFRVGWVAAKFKRDEMVLFVIFQPGIGIAIFCDLFDFQAVRIARFRTDGFRAPPRVADRLVNILLRDFGIVCAWSARRFGVNIRRPDMRLDGFIAHR